MARTTATVGPSQSSSRSSNTPAMIDRTRLVPVEASARQAASPSPGFTATTAPSAAIGVAVTITPGRISASAVRRSASASTTATLPASHPPATSPPTRAVPIRPPPTTTSLGRIASPPPPTALSDATPPKAIPGAALKLPANRALGLVDVTASAFVDDAASVSVPRRPTLPFTSDRRAGDTAHCHCHCLVQSLLLRPRRGSARGTQDTDRTSPIDRHLKPLGPCRCAP